MEDDKTLAEAMQRFIKQLEALEEAKSKIKFVDAGENLAVYFRKQQDMIFCNASDTLPMVELVVESSDDWDRQQEEAEGNQKLGRQRAKLETRENGLPADTCRNI